MIVQQRLPSLDCSTRNNQPTLSVVVAVGCSYTMVVATASECEAKVKLHHREKKNWTFDVSRAIPLSSGNWLQTSKLGSWNVITGSCFSFHVFFFSHLLQKRPLKSGYPEHPTFCWAFDVDTEPHSWPSRDAHLSSRSCEESASPQRKLGGCGPEMSHGQLTKQVNIMQQHEIFHYSLQSRSVRYIIDYHCITYGPHKAVAEVSNHNEPIGRKSGIQLVRKIRKSMDFTFSCLVLNWLTD